MKPNLTTVFKPELIQTNNNQEKIKNLQEGVSNLSPKIEQQNDADFLQSIKNAIDEVSENQTKKCRANQKI